MIMRVEMIAHDSGDLLPIILGDDGLPLVTPNEFIISRRALSANTLIRNARALAIFHSWIDRQKIDLECKITGIRSFSEAELNGSLLEFFRRDQGKKKKVKKINVDPKTINQRLTTVRQYLVWYCGVLAGMVPNTSQDYERISKNKDLIVSLIDRCFIKAPPTNRVEKSLSIRHLQALKSLLDLSVPGAFGKNEAVNCRNYVMVMIMLHYGLRPGELLSLRVEDIEIGAISAIRVTRRPPDKNDTRKPRPQIKRNGRVLPIDDFNFAKKLDSYISEYRDVLSVNAKFDSDYLILSDEGAPLSQSSVIQFFQILRKRYSDKLPKHLSAKTLRHVFSCEIEKQLRDSGVDEERRRKALAYLRGDSSLNSQNVYIDKEIEEQAHRALKRYQQGIIQEVMPW